MLIGVNSWQKPLWFWLVQVTVHTITVLGAGTYTVGDTANAWARVFAAGGPLGGSLEATDYVALATNGEVAVDWNLALAAQGKLILRLGDRIG